MFATPARRARIDSGLMPPVHRHMSRDLLTVEAGLPVVAAAQRMAERNVGAVLVMEDGRLAGIMTERDLMRAFARGLRDDAVVGECMTANPETIAPDDTIEHAAVLMIHGGYRHLPVVDGDRPDWRPLDPRLGAGLSRGHRPARCVRGPAFSPCAAAAYRSQRLRVIRAVADDARTIALA